MKKVLLATLFATFTLGMSAQAFEYVPLDAKTGQPLVPSVPALPSIPSYGIGSPAPPTSQVSVVGGYTATRDGRMVHVKLRVCARLGQSVGPYVLAVYEPNSQKWFDNKVRAQKILPMVDGQFLADNFEWSANTTLYGTVYFNF